MKTYTVTPLGSWPSLGKRDGSAYMYVIGKKAHV